MKLTTMRYKSYIWPHNPKTYTMSYERRISPQQLALGGYKLQDLGMTHRMIRGEGEFVGPEAYDEFRKLASVFYNGGSGTLTHPSWQSIQAYFVELTVVQEPRADYVSYSFAFWEDGTQIGRGVEVVSREAPALATASQTVNRQKGTDLRRTHIVVSGESMWKIAALYDLSVPQIIALNPQVKNPDRIHPGQEVYVE